MINIKSKEIYNALFYQPTNFNLIITASECQNKNMQILYIFTNLEESPSLARFLAT